MIVKFVFFTVLIAFNANGDFVKNGGVLAFWKLSTCNAYAATFFKKNKMSYIPCRKILKTKFDVIAAQKIIFQWDKNSVEYVDSPKVIKLRRALKAIERLHKGKSKDSHRVRAIIKKALK